MLGRQAQWQQKQTSHYKQHLVYFNDITFSAEQEGLGHSSPRWPNTVGYTVNNVVHNTLVACVQKRNGIRSEDFAIVAH